MQEKVYLYSTCLGSATMGQMVVSAATLLQKCGVQVIFKKDQTCCGQPSYNTGYFEESKKIALYNVNLFKEKYPVLVPSGSCAGMMMHDYLEMFREDPNYERISEFSSRVMDLSKFLDERLPLEDKGDPIKVTWHSNCHALRVANCIESSKNLLRKLKNVELVDLQREEECCGFGGTFSIKEPAISNEMAKSKIKYIKETGVKYLISGDGGCLMNITGTMSRLGEDIKGIHLYDFLLKRIEGEIL